MKEHLSPEYQLKFTVSEKNNTETLSFVHSNHSITRASQRGVTSDMIGVVMEYGKAFFKQGCVFYVLGQKTKKIPNDIMKNWKKYKNLIVMVSGTDNTIITCYRNENPFQHIKKKSIFNKKTYKNVA